MGRNRFLKSEPHRIFLSDGDWIEVRKDLNTGEQKKLENAGLRAQMVDGRIFHVVDWEVHEIERAMVVLLDWSFKGEDDKPVELSADALRHLDPADFQEINNAIMQHIIDRAKEKNAQREVDKKMKSTLPEDRTTSTETSS